MFETVYVSSKPYHHNVPDHVKYTNIKTEMENKWDKIKFTS